MIAVNFCKFCIISLTLVLSLYACKDKTTSGENTGSRDTEELLSTDVVEQTTEITFEKDRFNFGKIEAGEVVNYDFKFTNTGKHDLIISAARPSCGCTVPDYPKYPVRPGESDVIKVQFNSKNKKGQQDRSVTIVANTRPSETKIYITGTVEESR
jgi:hypothetical protein